MIGLVVVGCGVGILGLLGWFDLLADSRDDGFALGPVIAASRQEP